MSAIKVTIPNEVAAAIEELRGRGRTNKELVEFISRPYAIVSAALGVLQRFAAKDFDGYVSAIINGYEVEKSAEELAEEERKFAHDRIRVSYQFFMHGGGRTRTNPYCDGIAFALNELGIKITGVNA